MITSNLFKNKTVFCDGNKKVWKLELLFCSFFRNLSADHRNASPRASPGTNQRNANGSSACESPWWDESVTETWSCHLLQDGNSSSHIKSQLTWDVFLSKSMHVKSYPVFRCFSWAIDFHFQDPKVSGRWYSRRWWYHGWNALSESIRTTLLAWTRRQFGFLNSHTSKAFKSYQQNKLLCRVSIVDVSAFFKSDAKCKFLPTQMWQCDRCIKW